MPGPASLRGLGKILPVNEVPAVFPRLWVAIAVILAMAAGTRRHLLWVLYVAAPHSSAQRWVSGYPRRVCEEARGPERLSNLPEATPPDRGGGGI